MEPVFVDVDRVCSDTFQQLCPSPETIKQKIANQVDIDTDTIEQDISDLLNNNKGDQVAQSIAQYCERLIKSEKEQAKQWFEKHLDRFKYDVLTPLYNKRTFLNCKQKIDQKKQDAAFIMIDLDNFKTVNDAIGHRAGDATLGGFGSALNAIFKQHFQRVNGEKSVSPFYTAKAAMHNYLYGDNYTGSVTDYIDNPAVTSDAEVMLFHPSGDEYFAIVTNIGDNTKKAINKSITKINQLGQRLCIREGTQNQGKYETREVETIETSTGWATNRLDWELGAMANKETELVRLLEQNINKFSDEDNFSISSIIQKLQDKDTFNEETELSHKNTKIAYLSAEQAEEQADRKMYANKMKSKDAQKSERNSGLKARAAY